VTGAQDEVECVDRGIEMIAGSLDPAADAAAIGVVWVLGEDPLERGQ
jgi:hypothetical protein